jgi:predicted AlkP superfamily phosphohydrolase/phosphomutase
LLALRDPASGETIVARAFTADEKFGHDHHPDLPDLICVFRTDLGMIEHCESPAVGRVHVPVYHPHAPRTGDHTVNSRLWLCRPGIEAGGAMREANVLDIAPTVLRLLDVELPVWLDGESLVTAHDAAHRLAGQVAVEPPAAATAA